MEEMIDGLIGNSGKVPRVYLGVVSVLSFLTYMEFVRHESMQLRWTAIFRGEVWRLFTATLYPGVFSFGAAMQVYWTYNCLTKIESEVFNNASADFVTLLAQMWIVLLVFHFIFTYPFSIAMQPFLAFEMFVALTHLWGQKCPLATSQIILFSIPARYLSWWWALFQTFYVGWNPNIGQAFLGIICGHVVYFFNFFLPEMPLCKNMRLLGRTPNLLVRLLDT